MSGLTVFYDASVLYGRADVIVTANLRDFPASILGQYGIEPQHPDDFILCLLDVSPGLVARAARDHRESLKNPPRTIKQYLHALELQGLRRTVSVLREYVK